MRLNRNAKAHRKRTARALTFASLDKRTIGGAKNGLISETRVESGGEVSQKSPAYNHYPEEDYRQYYPVLDAALQKKLFFSSA
jgi:hypothetical protein